MDLGSTLFGAAMLLLCTLPFIIDYRNRKKKEKNLFQFMADLAQTHQCQIKQSEFCGDFVMALDEKNNFVFFSKKRKDEVVSAYAELSEIKTFEVVKKTRTLKHKEGESVITEKVELCFTSKNGKEIKFELYDEEINRHLSGELQFVEKWSKLINDLLKNKS